MRRFVSLLLALGCIQCSRSTMTAPQPTANVDAGPPLACGPGRSVSGVDQASGLVPVWRVDLGPRTGELKLDVVDGLVVAKVQGGRSVTLDAETGGQCAELVAPLLSGPEPAIDPYTGRSNVAHGILVGGAKYRLGAIDIRTGAVRWSRELFSPDTTGEFDLRDNLQTVATSKALIVGTKTSRLVDHAYRWQEVVTALDPHTGSELWRNVAVDSAPGQPTSARDDMRLEVSGSRTLVLTNGKLVAYDGDGREAWTTSFPAQDRMPGRPQPVDLLPLVAADAESAAIALDGRIQLVDGRTGTARGEVAVSGTPTDLVATGGMAFAAVESRPGTASVVAIAMAKARALWTFNAAYSVRRLRADEARVYVLDGNRRIWALDRATGAVQAGLGTDAFDFAVGQSRAGTPRIFVPNGPALAAFDLTALPAALRPFARWELDVAHDDGSHPRAIAWVDGDDRVVWTHEVPPRLREVSIGTVTGYEAVRDYRRHPRDFERLPGVFGTIANRDTLVEADVTGVLALRIRDGVPELDVATAIPSAGHAFSFDSGTFEVTGLAECAGPSRRAKVFTRCGERFVYFNGVTALVLSGSPLRVEARGTYVPTSQPKRARNEATYEATIQIGPYTLRLHGRIFRGQ